MEATDLKTHTGLYAASQHRWPALEQRALQEEMGMEEESALEVCVCVCVCACVCVRVRVCVCMCVYVCMWLFVC